MQTGSGLAGLRVLIVVDEAGAGDRLTRCFVAGGCQVIGLAGNLESALQLARESNPQLVVVDVRLQEAMARALANALRSRNVRLVIVADSPQELAAFRRTGANGRPFEHFHDLPARADGPAGSAMPVSRTGPG